MRIDPIQYPRVCNPILIPSVEDIRNGIDMTQLIQEIGELDLYA